MVNADPLLAADARPVPLSESESFTVEEISCEEHAKDLRRLHPQDPGVRAQPIGLTFSGGDSRAAAFHCGVLWSLAHQGLMKDVTQLSSTSGGAYTACSLLSHLFQMSSEAEQAPSLDVWYKQVVASTSLRMQHNINWLVDWTPSRRFGRPAADKPEEVGSGWGWRIFDLPLLVVSISAVLTVSPVLLFVHTVWPVVLHIEMEHGHMLRSAWCSPQGGVSWWGTGVSDWLSSRMFWLAACAISAVVLNLVALPSPASQRAAPYRYLILRSLRQIVQRGATLYLVYTLLVLAILYSQYFEWGSAAHEHVIGTSPTEVTWVRSLCYKYIQAQQASRSECADSDDDGTKWYNVGHALEYYGNQTWSREHATLSHHSGSPGQPFSFVRWRLLNLTNNSITSVSVSTFIVLGFLVLLIAPTLLKWIFTLAFPFIYLILLLNTAKWRTYGPITGQYLLPMEWTAYTEGRGAIYYRVCVGIAVITLPIYDVWQKIAHAYYRRSLTKAFFHGGQDISDAALATCPYCPNMLLGACLHDYRRPGDDENLVDFTISSFFVGSRRTGFFYTPSQARLAHLMTMAGAAPDALVLKEMDTFLVRVVLAVLCFRFGDFLRLEGHGETAVRVCKRIKDTALRLSRSGAIKMNSLKKFISEDNDLHAVERNVQGLIDRLPAAVLVLFCHLMLLAGTLQNGRDCNSWRALQNVAFYFFVILVACSFFAFLQPLQWLMRSPMVQQFQMLVMHCYKAKEPPPYVYVCDGGLIEVLGLLPLLRRRMKCIVVSDAADDPHLTMRCLREASANVRKENLCSFFDPRHPNRDFEFTLRELSTSKESFFKMGVLFEPKPGDTEPEIGWVYYVRMRRRPDDMAPIRGLLTKEELMGPPQTTESGLSPPTTCTWGSKKLRNDMTGACFPWLLCGGIFIGRMYPNFGVSNQCLSPIHFANLCGLGAEQSECLVKCLTEDRSARAS